MNPAALDSGQAALVALLDRLEAEDYAFTAVTPATHKIVTRRRRDETAEDLRDVFGWGMWAAQGDFTSFAELLDAAGVQERAPPGEDGVPSRWRSQVRVARLSGRLLLYSGPSVPARDAVFLGPDTYRFARFIRGALTSARPVRRVVDIGGGSGAGCLACADLAPRARRQITDINPLALRLAAANATHASVEVELVKCAGLDAIAPGFDLAIANPPFMAGSGRLYSDGGDLHGAQLSLEWAAQALEKVAAGGRLLMYTASAILAGGEDRLRDQMSCLARRAGAQFEYSEVDPDIFGAVLSDEIYIDVERIAAVCIDLRRD